MPAGKSHCGNVWRKALRLPRGVSQRPPPVYLARLNKAYGRQGGLQGHRAHQGIGAKGESRYRHRLRLYQLQHLLAQ